MCLLIDFTTGYVNELVSYTRGSSLILMTLIYELGIWGPLFIFLIFIKLYKIWKESISVGTDDFLRWHHDIFPSVLIVFFFSAMYNAALAFWILSIFFGINFSLIKKMHQDVKIQG